MTARGDSCYSFAYMDRTKLSYGLFVLLLLCLGIALGFWITGIMTALPSSHSSTTTVKTKHIVFPSGYCCMSAGSPCISASGPLPCLHGGGKLFDPNQKSCDAICAQMKK